MKIKRIKRRFRRFKDKYYKILMVAFVILAVAFVAYIFRDNNASEEKSASQQAGLPTHNCSTGAFTKTVSRGETVSFNVTVNPSRFWSPYRVKMGNLPNGVTAEVENPDGRGKGDATVTLHIGEETKSANFSLIMVYEELQKDGTWKPSRCQYNLIVN
jgi:hypothetical protein